MFSLRTSASSAVQMPFIASMMKRILDRTTPRLIQPKRNQIGDISMFNAKAYSAASETSPLASTTIPRRDTTEHDVQIEILFCGICHSDLHTVRNEWSEFMATNYPIVPGHEIV